MLFIPEPLALHDFTDMVTDSMILGSDARRIAVEFFSIGTVQAAADGIGRQLFGRSVRELLRLCERRPFVIGEMCE